ncbi:putative lipopolysaccharide heptosyltransferase III [hot springs metagenome]|uniref:Putative lipopolysaccharide heptosyltransferase III n=1 Tax=hot springs metagenome TaxID=433727 RepID=A0A5J4KWF9_9ZZZZ
MNHTFKNVHRILVIKLRHIGDVLLTAPVFRALKEKFPDAQITALVNSGTEDVLKGNTLIDEILIMDRSIKRLSIIQRYAKEIVFLKDIRANGFDMTIDLTGGDRAAVISFASGARYRLGWKSDKGFIGKKYVYTHLSEPDANKHIVLQNLDVISQFGITTEDLTVNFYIPDDDRIFIKDILRKYNADKETNIVHIHPTSRWLFKCWKDEYMAEVIRWLLDRGNRVIVTSSPDKKEVEKAKKILSLVGNSRSSLLIDLCGKTTIKQLGAISEVSNLFFGVDSAPMHIAAAVGTPVVALFGPSGTFHWGPWDNNSSHFTVHNSQFKSPYKKRNGIQTFAIHTVIQRDWDCIPCGKDGCNGSKISKCLDDIRPDEVIEIIKNVIIK